MVYTALPIIVQVTTLTSMCAHRISGDGKHINGFSYFLLV